MEGDGSGGAVRGGKRQRRRGLGGKRQRRRGLGGKRRPVPGAGAARGRRGGGPAPAMVGGWMGEGVGAWGWWLDRGGSGGVGR